MAEKNSNGWNEWKHYVLEELKRLADCSAEIDKKLDLIAERQSALMVKAGVWGIFGGAIPVVIGLGVYFIERLISR